MEVRDPMTVTTDRRDRGSAGSRPRRTPVERAARRDDRRGEGRPAPSGLRPRPGQAPRRDRRRPGRCRHLLPRGERRAGRRAHRRWPARSPAASGSRARSPGSASRCCSAATWCTACGRRSRSRSGSGGHLGRRPGPEPAPPSRPHEAEAEGLNLTFAPMIDISSEHRWGRIGETFGDEPLLAGRIGAATVAGLQADGRFAATAKHFCGYGLVQAERDHETLSVGLNTLHNRAPASLPGGRRGRRARRSWSASTTSTACRCTPTARWSATCSRTSGASPGVVVSDWDGIGQLVHQGVASDLRDAARQAMLAGVDLDMVSGAYRDLPARPGRLRGDRPRPARRRRTPGAPAEVPGSGCSTEPDAPRPRAPPPVRRAAPTAARAGSPGGGLVDGAAEEQRDPAAAQQPRGDPPLRPVRRATSARCWAPGSSTRSTATGGSAVSPAAALAERLGPGQPGGVRRPVRRPHRPATPTRPT